MKNARWKIIFPIIIILFPVLFWIILTRGHNSFKHLPVIGPVEVNEKGDTLYHNIGTFSFVNQEGKTISNKSLEGKIHVANFFFATCKSICPQMNEQVQRVEDKFRNDDQLKFLTFTVDPIHDSVAVLADYAKKMNAQSSQWWFLTGNKDSIYALARNGYLVPAAAGKTADDFFHSQDLILVDRAFRIRGVYDGTDPAEVDTLIDEIKLLEHEYLDAGHGAN